MPWSNTIADILQQQGEQGAATARAIANIASTGALNRGRIIAGAVSDIGNTLTSLPYQKAKLQEEADQSQIRQLTAQHLQGEITDAQKKRDTQAKVQAILQQHGDDIPSAIKDVMGVDAGAGMALSQHWNDVQSAATTFKMNQLKADQQKNEFLEHLVSGATDQPTYTKKRAIAIQSGLATPDQLPEDYQQALPQLKQLSLSVMSAKERYDLQQKQIEDDIKKQEEERKRIADANKGKDKSVPLDVPGPNGTVLRKSFSPDELAQGVRIAPPPSSAQAPQPQLLQDKDGNIHAYQFSGGRATEIPLPEGLKKAGAGGASAGEKPLPAATAENLSGINAAEVQGVKVLRALKSAGLDQSNDPADPRWQKFLVTEMKIAPDDFNKADIQQRTAYVNAILTRGLMGGRPAQYIAQMIQQHMPQGEMSGAQLFHVMSNVLEESSSRRGELAALQKREPSTLEPKTGENYSQFLKSLSGEVQQRPTDTTGFKVN